MIQWTVENRAHKAYSIMHGSSIYMYPLLSTHSLHLVSHAATVYS